MTIDAATEEYGGLRAEPIPRPTFSEPEPLAFSTTGQIVLWYGVVVPEDWGMVVPEGYWADSVTGPYAGKDNRNPFDAWMVNLWVAGEIDLEGPIPWCPSFGPHELDRAKNWAAHLVANNTDLVVTGWVDDEDGGEHQAELARRIHRLTIQTTVDAFTVDVTPQQAQDLLRTLRHGNVRERRLMEFELPLGRDVVLPGGWSEVARRRIVRSAELVGITELVVQAPYQPEPSLKVE
jgi:hypothetical protein